MSATVLSAQDIVREESRLRPRVAVVAAISGVLILAAAIIPMVGPHTSIDEATLDLIYAHKRAGLDLLSAILSSVGSLAIGATLVFLFRAARARNPKATPFISGLVIAGAVLSAISSFVYDIEITHKASQFVAGGDQGYVEAHNLTSSGGLVALQLAGLLGVLFVAMSLVLVSLQAMRVGLLTRFMGYVGMFAGVLIIFSQLMPLPVVEIFWFLALAVLLAGYWPSAEPPAWRSGQAEPWPSAQSMREQRIRAASGASGRQAQARGGGGKPPVAGKRGSDAASTPVAPAPAPAARGAAARGAAAKRKRKRRR